MSNIYTKIPAISLLASAVVLVFVMLVFPFSNLITEAGIQLPAGMSLEQYINSLKIHYVTDSIFIFLWLIGWCGVAMLVWRNSGFLAILSITFAILGKLLDFTENSLFWVIVNDSSQSITDQVAVWSFVSHVSFALPFAAVVTAAAGLWSKSFLSKCVCIWGILFIIPSCVSLYFAQFGMVMGLWAWIWFIMTAFLLWKDASTSPSHHAL